MRTIVSLVIDHKKPIPELAEKVAQRAYTLDGVSDVNPCEPDLIALPVVDVMEQHSRVFKEVAK